MGMEGQPNPRPVKVRKVKVIRPPEEPAVKPVIRPVAAPKPVPVAKPRPGSKPVSGPPEVPPWFRLEPWKMDPARVFHFGHALIWFLELGVKHVRIKPDWSVEVGTHDGRVLVIPALVMMTRDRRYSFQFIRDTVNGKDTNNLQWQFDQYDKELAGLLKQWATKD